MSPQSERGPDRTQTYTLTQIHAHPHPHPHIISKELEWTKRDTPPPHKHAQHKS